MRAMVFAAGLGTRLKPFTLEHPKALVPVGGVPMLQRVLLKIKSAGITDVVVNVHHFAEQIVDFLKANGNFGIHISISDETSLLLDTGGGILAAAPLLDGNEPILVHNADILTDFSIDAMAADFGKADALASLFVSERRTSRYLLFDGDMRMRGWKNLSTGQVLPPGLEVSGKKALAFGGVHIISPRVFPLLRDYAQEAGPVFPIIPFYVQACQNHNIVAFSPNEPYMWHDIGKPESLAAATKAIL